MKKKISIVLALALGLATVSLAAEGIWTTKSPMPTGRWDLSNCVVDGKIYAIGGASSYRSKPLRTVEEYDPSTDTWTMKSEMPTERQGLSTSVVNGKIYAIGGIDLSSAKNFSTVEEYDPAKDTWTTKSEMPTARAFHSANTVDGRIYVIGGARSSPWSGTILTIEVYDPATDTWTRKGVIPRPVSTASTSMVDGKIYAIGGEGTGRRVDEYDPVTDTWTRKADMPTPRTDLSTSVVDGKIYAIGGDGTGIVATVEVYDPATDTWTTAPDMPTARTGLRTSAVNGKIYAIGGLTTWGGTGLRTVEEYDPPIVVDFNGDEIVNFKDFCMLAQYWYQDQSPFSDRRVDYESFAVLAENWLADFRLVGHWKLDETEGSIAHDSIGDNDCTLYGQPLWQPTAGKIDGAIQLDGIDDYISASLPLDSSDLSFSAFAWVKGGTPGQVIISQMNYIVGRTAQVGSTWLGTDSSDGRIMTKLLDPLFPPLESELVITDGQWHYVGLVYDFDGFCRRLYVDGAEVARDETVVAGLLSPGSLRFGADKDLSAGSFFSGLIDDIQIYNVALSAKEIEERAR